MASLFSSSYNISLFVCYSESYSAFLYGSLGISKFRTSESVSICYTTIDELHFSFRSGIPKHKLLLSTLSNCLWGTCFGYFSKYRIKGLGHRIYIKRNNFVYKIGYSHTLYKLLDLNLVNSQKRFKKEYYFAVRGLDLVCVRNSVFLIQSYRIPNSYCHNGIFVQGIIINAKEGKKGFML